MIHVGFIHFVPIVRWHHIDNRLFDVREVLLKTGEVFWEASRLVGSEGTERSKQFLYIEI